ncbi:3-oxoacyl-ACP synthase III family protein [Roseisolibacter agri]|uniref:3-oxoacyl-[acyl-carrier-protein] synthase 3 n=1 Tax=Roseisolibacter agri TaxID=2014610 RepID=A0AA37Q709_9BACT|nr:ketoacyl-ACP synthase III [Roseisolibacter agri]GLC27724.1 3-oxoacyl-[acyl-carrier-protein] synthase 3 [Roseisolibacter agri]
MTHPPAFATITGTGSTVPERIVTNAELSAQLGVDVEDFVANTLGIRERRWCAPDESTADLAERAGRAALEDAGLTPEDLDLLIVATDTPEYVSPATSSVVQGRLGAWRAGTFDVNSGCAGFVTALDVAQKYIAADPRYNRVLVIGAYAMSKFLDQQDKKTVTIFADGAGAAVVERSDAPGVVASELFADGRLAPGMGVFAGGTAEPITEDVLRDGYRNRLRFVQKYPASVNEEGWPRIARDVVARAGATPNQVDLWLWTQVNRSTIEVVMRTLGQPMERAHTIMHKWGYTGSACLPMALDDARRAGRLREGDLVVLTGSGAGLSMGCVAMRWHPVAWQPEVAAR